VIVNYLEWIALEQVIGQERARAAMDFWRSDHYAALYAIVIAHRERLTDIVERHGLSSPTDDRPTDTLTHYNNTPPAG
jgi:hypothetical protein